MKPLKKRQKHDGSKSFVDLPEQLFREILKYLDNETIYFVMRNVSQEWKNSVDQYTELGGVFIITGTSCCFTKLMYIFKRYGKELESYYEIAPDFPFRNSSRYSHTWQFPDKKDRCGNILHNRVVVGNYQLINLVSVDEYKKHDVSGPNDIFKLCSFDYSSRKWIPPENITYCTETHDENWRLPAHPELALFHAENEFNLTTLGVLYLNIGCSEGEKHYPRSNFSF